MRIPSTFVHYSERGGAADSCEHLFVEVSWGGIFTYLSIPGLLGDLAVVCRSLVRVFFPLWTICGRGVPHSHVGLV